jgi:hypothetical protein
MAGKGACSHSDRRDRRPACIRLRPTGFGETRRPPDGGPGTREGPAWFGWLVAQLCRQTEEDRGFPRPQRIGLRQPRTRESIPPSAVGTAGGVQVLVFTQDPWNYPLLGLPIGLAFTGAERPASEEALAPRSIRIALASFEQVHDCPPCGGDGGSIAQGEGV